MKYLREHLVNGNVNYNHGLADRCTYINFWLNREIRSFNNLYYESNFNLLKEFEEQFSIAKLGKAENGCKNIINYIDSDTYKKLETIYKFYEQYDILKSTNLDDNVRCDAFGNMIAIYKKAIEKYDNEEGKDYNLIKKLLELKYSSVTSYLPHYSNCKYREREFNKPNKYLKHLEEEAKKKRQQEEELQRRKQEAEELQTQKQELEKQKSQQRKELGTNDPLSNGENLLSATITQHRNTGPSLGVESLGGLGYRARHEFERTLPFLTEQQEQTDRGYGELKDQNVDTSTTSGITGAIKDTFTTIVQNVDSAPVLGVSGGMGVLFLLFKVFKVL
ncbi:hypothetical protein PVNG_06292 [Plasmodium vivax North Korean]|uniref:VIR protein n=1 Tax=Plasmodium vivax North Korean TaxID=1035514 RepID=A0A0J9TL68_PLAVI|nr:hypothetical protein PVNG_06292 [Plasmodium vivax North Korean]